MEHIEQVSRLVRDVNPGAFHSFAGEFSIISKEMKKRKSVSVYRKNLIISQNDPEVNETWLNSLSMYDPQGNLLEQTVYNRNGSIAEQSLKEYNASGFLVREKNVSDDEDFTEEKSYEKDQNGLTLREFKHYTDGSADTTVYEYDSQYRISRTLVTNDDGETESSGTNEYDGDKLVKSLLYDGNDELIKAEEFVYDEEGKTVEHRTHDYETGEFSATITRMNPHGRKAEATSLDEDGDETGRIVFTEDDKGRLISMVEESGDSQTEIRFEYDEKGNNILHEEYDAGGNRVMYIRRRFDEEGNLLHSEVFIDGQGRRVSQHYEAEMKYEYYEE